METHKKISLKLYVWNGINYIFGITFFNYFASLVEGNNGDGIGYWVFLSYALAAFAAFMCVKCFKKVSDLYGTKHNGGALNYVQDSLGRKWGLLVGFLQVIFIVLVTCVGMDMIVKNIFSPTVVTDESSITSFTMCWGAFTNVYLDIIGILVISAFMCIPIFGINKFKKFSSISGIIKWVFGGAFILLGIVLMFMNAKDNAGKWAHNSTFDVEKFFDAFVVSFYTLSGFEILYANAENIENPDKNVSKAVTITISIVIGLTFLLMFISFMAYESLSSNLDIHAWTIAFGNKSVFSYIGISLSIVSIIMMYINGAIQDGLYSGSAFQPMCAESFFSKKYAVVTKEGISKKATITMVISCVAVALLFILLPDIIASSLINGHLNGERVHDIMYISQHGDIFNISDISEVASICSLFIYFFMFVVIFKLIKEKRIQASILEIICYSVSFIAIVASFFIHYESEIHSIIYSSQVERVKNIVRFTCEIAIFILVFAIYYFKYMNFSKKNKQTKKYHKY